MPRTAVAVASAALLAVALLPAPPAAAKEPLFRLKLKPVKEKVVLGEPIRLEVTLTSASPRAAAVARLELGSPQGLVLYVKTESKETFQVTKLFGKYQGNDFKESPVAREELKTGKSLAATVECLALRTGRLEISAVYLGGDRSVSPDNAEAKPVTVTVDPGPGGETKVGARVKTSKGTMVVELHPGKAWNTVNNFLTLGRNGFYNDIVFHRVVKDFMVQTGDPRGNGMGGPGYYIPGEPNDVKHEKGILSMALEGHRNTGGSQFFIMTGKAAHLDGTFSPFGRVVEGMEVLDALNNVETRMTVGGRPEKSDPVEKPKLLGVETVLLK